MAVKPLTNTEARNAKARERDYALSDGFGLSLIVRKTGNKSWHFRYYSPYTGKRQTLVIGPYPEFSIDEAREARSEARKHLANGIDPIRVKEERLQRERDALAHTVKIFSDDWIKYKESHGLTKMTIYSMRGTLRRNVIPEIGDMPITKVTPRTVMPLLNRLRDAEKLTTMHETANYLRNMLDYAVNTGVIEFNPLAKISSVLPKYKTKHFSTIPAQELHGFLHEIDEAYYSDILKNLANWQLLTMVRPVEARGARWEEIDLDKKEWTIPAERMKKRKYHVVPLSTQAIALFEKIRNQAFSDEYIFPAITQRYKPVSDTLLRGLINITSYKGRIVPHGFRAMASTTLHEHGFNPDVIEAALAHKCRDVVRAIYNRSTYLEQRRVMMQWWGDFIESARNGEDLTKFSESSLRVVSF